MSEALVYSGSNFALVKTIFIFVKNASSHTNSEEGNGKQPREKFLKENSMERIADSLIQVIVLEEEGKINRYIRENYIIFNQSISLRIELIKVET